MAVMIQLEVVASLATLRLDDPARLNALGTDMLGAIIDACESLSPEVRVLVVSGAGRAYTAGADLAAFDRNIGAAEADLGWRMADAVESVAAITIAQIHGACVGGGVVLAAACDLRFAAPDTYFSIPEVDLGIPLAWGGIPRLVREFPPAVARDLVLTGRQFSAAEAAAFGFLNAVVPAEELDKHVGEYAALLAAKPAAVLAANKRGFSAALAATRGRPWEDARRLVEALADPESRQAAAAYLARLRSGDGG